MRTVIRLAFAHNLWASCGNNLFATPRVTQTHNTQTKTHTHAHTRARANIRTHLRHLSLMRLAAHPSISAPVCAPSVSPATLHLPAPMQRTYLHHCIHSPAPFALHSPAPLHCIYLHHCIAFTCTIALHSPAPLHSLTCTIAFRDWYILALRRRDAPLRLLPSFFSGKGPPMPSTDASPH